MPTNPSWQAALASLRKLTTGVTREQRELAARVRLKLPKSLPRGCTAKSGLRCRTLHRPGATSH